ncbi:MAG: hypothetical protein EBQ89_02225 [Alphaproteobacteria bacterium]|nr:hypothetical protein [Alphaproteobacteria bacterium]
MSRNINISITEPSDKNTIHINDLASIINYSCDSIKVACLEFLPENAHGQVINILLSKLKPLGKLIITINNVTSITKNFMAGSMSYQDFLTFFQNKQSLLSIDSLYTFIDFNTFDIIHINQEEYFTTLFLERKQL